MSVLLIAAVLESSLPAWLKSYAVAYANFASDDGTRVFPSVKTIARNVGRTPRQVQNAIAELRALGVLELVRPHGPGRATTYRFNVDALEAPAPASSRRQAGTPTTFARQLRLFARDGQEFPQPKPAKVSTISGFQQIQQAYTGNPFQAKGEMGFTRSVSDPSVRTCTGEQPRRKANAR